MPDDATRKAVGCSATLLMVSNVAAVVLLAGLIPVAQWGLRPLAAELEMEPRGVVAWLLSVSPLGVAGVAAAVMAMLVAKHYWIKSPGWKLVLEIVASVAVTVILLLLSAGVISFLSQAYQTTASGSTGP